MSVRRRDLRQSLRVTTIAWMYGVVWMVFISGAHVNQFVRMLGFDNFAFGLMAAMPFAATFGQVIAAVLIERTGLRKYQFVYCATIHRLLWLVAAAIPLLLPLPSPWAVWAMLITLWLSWFLSALAQPAWMTWMADLIPRRIRGRYFATRARIGRAVQIVAILGVGAALDAATRRGAAITAAAQPLLLYCTCAVFAAAAVFGATDILLFRRIREVLPSQDTPRRPAVEIDFPAPRRRTPIRLAAYAGRCFLAGCYQLLLAPLRDRVFRHYAAYGVTITFALSVAGPFFMRNALESLGFTQLGANFVYMAVGPIAGLTAVKLWGRLIDRWGRRPVLIVATLCVVLSIMPNFFAAPQTPSPRGLADGLNWLSAHAGALVGRPGWHICPPGSPLGAYLLIMLSVVVGGAGWTGVMLAQHNVFLAFSDRKGGSKFVAAAAVLVSLGGVLGGVVGGRVAAGLSRYQANPIIWGPFLWNNWHATFLLSMLARAMAILWLLRMPDPGSGTVRGMLRYMTGNVYNNVATRLFYPLRIFGWRRPPRARRDGADQPGRSNSPDERS